MLFHLTLLSSISYVLRLRAQFSRFHNLGNAVILLTIFQYFLYVLGNSVGSRYRSGPTVLHDVRALSSGTQSYDTNKLEWPVNQPVKKLEADIQVGSSNNYSIYKC